MSTSLEERLTELEVRVAFMDDLMGTLNDTVAGCQLQILEMRMAMERLRDELVSMRGALPMDARDEPPPPHY